MKFIFFILLNLSYCPLLVAQAHNTNKWWHDKERILRYHPEGTDFVITNGNRRFTRALYGTNTAFRAEAGDLPEFALYMPGMGGNLKFGLSNNDTSKWLINADRITARYRPGSMIYDIEDNILGKGKMHLIILAMADKEGIIIKMQFEDMQSPVKLIWAYGGASGKRFSRDGDMGPDPESSFYLKPENCTDNSYRISGNTFTLKYGSGLVTEWDPYVNRNLPSDTVKAAPIGKEQRIAGIIPPSSDIHVADAGQQISPAAVYRSKQSRSSIITGRLDIKSNETYFFALQKPDSSNSLSYTGCGEAFNKAESARKTISNRIKILTPDRYINTLGGVLGIAADAIWESPTYLHGSIGWRMRLNGWRGPYVADALSWHDRAKTHFKAYALSQVTSPLTGPVVMDTALHLARSLEKMGTSIYSSGYICRNPNGDFRPHHYDMNLVFIDALLRHFDWTGDLVFAKEMWPVITRHLAWEKRNFDPDDDGLYDAYAAIWASDALQYSGGAVTHSSAYNYMANKKAGVIAKLIGENEKPFQAEAAKILNAINTVLWIPSKGTYAEFKDLLGNKLLHSSPAVWTLYHSIDSDLPDPFQAYQSTRYIDVNIPHIPVKAKGLDDGFYTISTSKWMPYDWSLNNVASAEVMHTALAYWQAGRPDKAFNLWKSELLSTMYLGGSPGNIGQISFYDAARGEAYRDFADPVAMVARSVVEGLFGILPNALKNELVIKPGFPLSWDKATIDIPDIFFDFKRRGKEDTYTIIPRFAGKMRLSLLLHAKGALIKTLTVNGEKYTWKNRVDVIGTPSIQLDAGNQEKYVIRIEWQGSIARPEGIKKIYAAGSKITLLFPGAIIVKLFDPQQILLQPSFKGQQLKALIKSPTGSHTAFVQLQQNGFTWWVPLHIEIRNPVEIKVALIQGRNSLEVSLINHTTTGIKGKLVINAEGKLYTRPMLLQPNATTGPVIVEGEHVVPGTNRFLFLSDSIHVSQDVSNWNTNRPLQNLQTLDMSNLFNDKITNIFKNQYLSPRPAVATLQLPTQGIGDWTHPLKTANIDDKGLRMLAGKNNQVMLPQGIPFSTPSDSLKPNILFTSQWDNYPKEVVVPLSGKAFHAYLLMAGSTNPMQSRIVNGKVIITYLDNTSDTLLLKNPETWWPIEQDYMDDGFAFTIDAAIPVRLHLKTGKMVSDYDKSISEYSGKMIDGGAATVLDMPLQMSKGLKELKLQTVANDVVIGLMAVTLAR